MIHHRHHHHHHQYHLVKQLGVDFAVLDVAGEVSCSPTAPSLKFRDDRQNKQNIKKTNLNFLQCAGWNTPKYSLNRWLSHKVHQWATILRFLPTIWFLQCAASWEAANPNNQRHIYHDMTILSSLDDNCHRHHQHNQLQQSSPSQGGSWPIWAGAPHGRAWRCRRGSRQAGRAQSIRRSKWAANDGGDDDDDDDDDDQDDEVVESWVTGTHF